MNRPAPRRRGEREAGGAHDRTRRKGRAGADPSLVRKVDHGPSKTLSTGQWDGQLDARLGELDTASLDDRLDPSVWPRYLPDPSLASPLPQLETPQPTVGAEADRAQRKNLQEPPTVTTYPAPAPNVPLPGAPVAPLTPAPASLPTPTPGAVSAPPKTDAAEATADNAKDPESSAKKGDKRAGPGKEDAGRDGKGEKKKDAKKEGKKQGGAAGGGAAATPAARSPAGEALADEAAMIEPDPLPPDESTALDVPLDMAAPSVAADWSAPDTLAAGVIPDHPRRSPADEETARNGKPEEKSKAAAEVSAHQRAREKALRAYADLAGAARGRQQRFLDEVSGVSTYMAHAYGMTANNIARTHETAIELLDGEAERQCAVIEANAGNAELDLQTAHDTALNAIRAAAGSAFGTINANDKATSALISKDVTSLKGGHQKRFTGEKEASEKAVRQAVEALQQWSDQRATLYPINAARPLDGAKHESYHPRIVSMAAAKVKEIGEAGKELVKAWTTTSDNSLCTVGCSYQFELNQARTQTFEAGRKAVSKALGAAKKGLAERLQQGLLDIRRLRQSALTQVRDQQRNSRSTLTSQARATLNGARRGAQGALGSVQNSARSALPGYWRALNGFEQSLRLTAPGGTAAITQTAQNGTVPILRGLDATTTALRGRLDENRQKLDSDQAEQQSTLNEQREQHRTAAGAAMARPPEDFAQQTAAALAKFNENGTQLANSVRDAAQSCAQKPERLFKQSFDTSRGRAQGSLDAVLDGGGKAEGKGEGAANAAKGGPGEAGPSPDCSGCSKEGGDGAGQKGGGESKGIVDQRKQQEEGLAPYSEPKSNPDFVKQLEKRGAEVAGEVRTADINATKALDSGFIDKVDEGAVTGALRTLTAAKGRAVDQRDYPDRARGPSLSADMLRAMGASDESYQAAIHYLHGRTKEGAKAELDASTNWYNDQEDRIEATMRALSPEDAAAIGADEALYERIHGALDGTDAKVFEALARSDPKKGGGAAMADALRMRDKIDEAKRAGDHEAVHAAEIQFTTMRGDDYNAKALADMDPDQRKQAEDAHRKAVAAALGQIVTEEDPTKKAALEGKSDAEKQAAYTQTAVDYVTRDVVMYAGGGGGLEVKGAKPGAPNTYTIKMEGANRDMASALLLHGKDSAEARAAKIGIEIQRKGDDAKAENIDEAVYDARFMPLPPHATEAEKKHHAEEVAKARELRAKTLLLAAEKYAGGTAPPKDYKTDTAKSLDPGQYPDGKLPDPHLAEAQQKLIVQLAGKFQDDKVGAEFVTNLIKEERPSAKTASLAMQYAMYSRSGTNEDLMFRYPERMTRDEIKAMKAQFRADTGKDFEAEAGLYGKGSFGELSGDDRLRMERAMLGVARTEQEKAEAAAFAMQQQRRETGSFGKWLAKGSYGEAVLDKTEAGLYASLGVTAEDFTPEGTLKPEAARRAFNEKGEFTGKDRDRFMANVMTGQLAAESYQAVIDKYANLATTGIAILGAIAAAVITVATGGAAGPLIAAAVISGLASMGASYAIKGGRYGWEQAAIDLGMTAVQAVTAGVGAKLGAAAQIASKGAQAASAASRTLTTLAKLFTGNPVVDQIIIGAVTGSLGGLAGAGFDEKTWEKGSGDAVGALFNGLIKGALSGAATAALTNSLEALGRNGAAIADRAKAIAAQGGLARGAVGLAGRGVGALGKGIDKGLNASTGGGIGKSLAAMGQRGLARSTISGLGGMAGRSTEILYDKSTGKYKGKLDDALADIGHAGLHAAVQGFGEGAGEAFGQGLHTRKLTTAGKVINEERVARGKPPLAGDATDPHSPLRAAAEDLMFMNRHGRHGGDDLGRWINLDHVVTHGGMAHTVAVQQPDAVAQDAMRGELLRHVPESLHGDFADVPIRVLSEAEYTALTRSESGPVVTLIEHGKPVVVIREGTPLSQLADEGPHLLQTADAATRTKVSKLDEATLARWDELDVDTQIDLYKNKIELEIDAHQRIADALDAQLARGDGDPAQLVVDRARNEMTLTNLRARQAEVGDITPSQRTAMQDGKLPRPQYLEQPARLFSKKAKDTRTPEQRRADDILETMLTEVGEKRRMAARGGLVDDDLQDLPDAVKPFLRRGDKMPGRSEVPKAVEAHARKLARERFGKMLQEALRDPGKHNALTMASMEHLSDTQLRHVRIHGELPKGVEFHHVLTVKDFPEFAHLAEAGLALPTPVHKEAGHGMDTTRPLEAATLMDPDALTRQQGFHNDPEGQKYNRAKEREVAEGSRSRGNVDEDLVIDFEQRVKRAESVANQADQTAARWPTTRNIAARDAARANLATARQHLAAVDARIANHALMQKALLRHIPPELHKQFGDIEIRVLSPRAYADLTRSENGPVVTLIVDGKPVVVVREGTHPARVADEGPHLMQARDAATGERVARLDEAELKHWDQLDLDTQLDLYQTKIGLEIDAHQRIKDSLEAELASAGSDAKSLQQEIARNNATLGNLRARQKEVHALGPDARAEIGTGKQTKPQYLEQPPRLFSKESLTQRFQTEIDSMPALAARAQEISRIRDPAARARAAAEFHASLIALRHWSNRMAGAGLKTDAAALAQMAGVAVQHQVPEAVLAAHLQEVIGSGRLPAGIAPDGDYARALLGLAEHVAGRPPLARTRSVPEALPEAPVAKAPAPEQQPAAKPEPRAEPAARELTPAEAHRRKNEETAAREVPDMIRALGLDLEILKGAKPNDLVNIRNALINDPIKSATPKPKGEKKPKGKSGDPTPPPALWKPTELQQAVARWALHGAGGDVGEFHSRMEFASARFRAIREAEYVRLDQTPNYRAVSAANAGKFMTPEWLDADLAHQISLIKPRAAGQHLSGPTAGMTSRQVARAAQGLDRIDFKSPTTEAYHAWKHMDDIPADFPNGSVIDRHHAAVMDTVRNGHVVVATDYPPPRTGTRVVIHRLYGENPGVWREAILHIEPDGKVFLASWSDCKAAPENSPPLPE